MLTEKGSAWFIFCQKNGGASFSDVNLELTFALADDAGGDERSAREHA